MGKSGTSVKPVTPKRRKPVSPSVSPPSQAEKKSKGDDGQSNGESEAIQEESTNIEAETQEDEEPQVANKVTSRKLVRNSSVVRRDEEDKPDTQTISDDELDTGVTRFSKGIIAPSPKALDMVDKTTKIRQQFSPTNKLAEMRPAQRPDGGVMKQILKGNRSVALPGKSIPEFTTTTTAEKDDDPETANKPKYFQQYEGSQIDLYDSVDPKYRAYMEEQRVYLAQLVHERLRDHKFFSEASVGKTVLEKYYTGLSVDLLWPKAKKLWFSMITNILGIKRATSNRAVRKALLGLLEMQARASDQAWYVFFTEDRQKNLSEAIRKVHGWRPSKSDLVHYEQFMSELQKTMSSGGAELLMEKIEESKRQKALLEELPYAEAAE